MCVSPSQEPRFQPVPPGQLPAGQAAPAKGSRGRHPPPRLDGSPGEGRGGEVAAILCPPLAAYRPRGGTAPPLGAVPPATPTPPGAQPRAPTAAAPPGAPGLPPTASPSSQLTKRGYPEAGRAATATGARSPVTGPGLAGPQPPRRPPPPPSPPPQPARLLPPRSTYRAAAAAGPARRSGGGCGADAEAPGSPRHPFVFELTPACRDSASPPDRAAGPFNNRRTAYPAAPARPAPPSPIGWTPPGVGAAPSVHWPPPAAQPRRPLPVLKLP